MECALDSACTAQHLLCGFTKLVIIYGIVRTELSDMMPAQASLLQSVHNGIMPSQLPATPTHTWAGSLVRPALAETLMHGHQGHSVPSDTSVDETCLSALMAMKSALKRTFP